MNWIENKGDMERDDLLFGFLDFSKPMRRTEIEGGTSNGRMVSQHVFTDEVKKRELDETTNYAQKYVTELEKDLDDVSLTQFCLLAGVN